MFFVNCSKCKKLKPPSEFYKDNRAKKGLQSQCKSCVLASQFARKREKALKTHKRCPDCKITKPIVEFNKNAARIDGLCSYCKLCEKERKARRDPEKVRERTNINARKRRQALINDLGGSCACCGETTYEFLEIDHIYNNGGEHRKELNRPALNTSDLRKHMDELQVLCGNCHNSKSHFEVCVHQSFKLINML